MGKLKDTIPQTGNLLPTTPVTISGGFLSQLTKLAQPVVKAETLKADPVQVMRAKFAANCDDTLKAVKAAADEGKFFRKLPNGKLLVAFRNANSVMKLGEHTHFQVDDAPAALKLIEAAKAACAAGELDDALKATQRVRPAKKQEPAKA